MNKPKLSKSGVPTIPMNEPMSWEDWLKGRRARRETGNRVGRGKPECLVFGTRFRISTFGAPTPTCTGS
jgi:hypothetical protein